MGAASERSRKGWSRPDNVSETSVYGLRVFGSAASKLAPPLAGLRAARKCAVLARATPFNLTPRTVAAAQTPQDTLPLAQGVATKYPRHNASHGDNRAESKGCFKSVPIRQETNDDRA